MFLVTFLYLSLTNVLSLATVVLPSSKAPSPRSAFGSHVCAVLAAGPEESVSVRHVPIGSAGTEPCHAIDHPGPGDLSAGERPALARNDPITNDRRAQMSDNHRKYRGRTSKTVGFSLRRCTPCFVN